MLGRAMMLAPQFIIRSEFSWMGVSVYMDRITQRSSAWAAASGANSSLASRPDCP
jgi:hypothetical protein